MLFESTSSPGPVALAQGPIDAGTLELCARIVARYADALPDGQLHQIQCRQPDGSSREISVEPLADPIIRPWLIGA